jgi:hypothetical protein
MDHAILDVDSTSPYAALDGVRNFFGLPIEDVLTRGRGLFTAEDIIAVSLLINTLADESPELSHTFPVPPLFDPDYAAPKLREMVTQFNRLGITGKKLVAVIALVLNVYTLRQEITYSIMGKMIDEPSLGDKDGNYKVESLVARIDAAVSRGGWEDIIRGGFMIARYNSNLEQTSVILEHLGFFVRAIAIYGADAEVVMPYFAYGFRDVDNIAKAIFDGVDAELYASFAKASK